MINASPFLELVDVLLGGVIVNKNLQNVRRSLELGSQKFYNN